MTTSHVEITRFWIAFVPVFERAVASGDLSPAELSLPEITRLSTRGLNAATDLFEHPSFEPCLYE